MASTSAVVVEVPRRGLARRLPDPASKNYVLHDAGSPSTARAEKKQGIIGGNCVVDENTFQTTLEYFLASLCDLQRAVTADRFGLRYSKSLEVTELLSKLEHCRFTTRDVVQSHPNIILSVLKEMFMNLPPVFENEEFLSLSQSASPELVICYLSSSIDALPLPNRQRAYLLCCSLRNLLDFTSHRGESLTDLLMLFTPVLFPRCTNTTEVFLRACRALLVMIEQNHLVFKKSFSSSGIEEDFLGDLLNSLDCLQFVDVDGGGSWPEMDAPICDDEPVIERVPLKDSQPYYTLAYCD
ncbi:hypothetical protein RB195_004348 [Necator americanus]|uniref:Rho-GAP domain-containing protein n=1 Tax=Necator americanus TaxID=51031 RepID=A0ABR1BHJ2_NECAM